MSVTQRLNAALVNQQVPLNAQTLDSQDLTDLLALLVGADNPTLMVTRAQIFRGPNNSSINVTGQSVLPGNVQVTSVKAVFEVADNALTMKLPLALAVAWKFSDSFPELKNSFFDALVISAPYLALASRAYTYTSNDGSVQVPLQSGLNFFSQLSITSNAADPLSPALQILQSAPAPTTLYGPITAADGEHDFQFVSKALGVTASLNLYSISALALSAVSVEIASLHGLQPQFRDSRAWLSATTNLGATEQVRIQLPIAPNGWLISMVADSAAPLTMPALLPVVGGQGLTSLLPTSLQNAINSIAISELFIRFSMMSGTSTVIDFTVTSTAGWTVIPNVLTIAQMQVSVNIEHDPATANYAGRTNFGGTINGTLTLSGIGIAVALEIPPSTGVDWDLKVAASDATFPTVAGLAQLLGGTDLDQAGLPPELGSPQGLTVAALEVLFNPFTPSLSSVYFTAEYTQNWQVGSGITFTDVLMNFNVDDPFNVNSSRLVWWAVAGSAIIAYTTSNTANDTILSAQISNDNAAALSLPGMANALQTGVENQPKTWNQLQPKVPADLSPFGLSTAGLAINLTRNVYMLWGTSTPFGMAALLFSKDASGNWGYLMSVALADTFRFASIWSGLSAIDGILTVRKASFAIASFNNGSAKEVIKAFPDTTVSGAPSPKAEVSQIIQLGPTSEVAAVGNGLNFYAELMFSSTLFGNVVKVLHGVDSQADLTLYGFVDYSNSQNTLFKAVFGTFSIFNTLIFSDVSLEYRPDKASELKLIGRMTVALGSTADDQYPFDGYLRVDTQAGHFQVSTPPNKPINTPLGMFGITFQNLSLKVDYNFTTTNPPALSIGGQVAFGRAGNASATVVLNGEIDFINGTALLVAISLAQPLSVLNFFSTVITGNSWPADFVDITFLSGSIYYYDRAADTGKVYSSNHRDGYNIDSTLDLFGIIVNIQVQVKTDGIIVSGNFTAPIDLSFLRFTNTSFQGSPALTIKALADEKSFGLGCGFMFFQEPFATAEIAVAKIGNNEPELRATLVYQGSIEEFRDSQLTFSYSEIGGFRINDWPFDLDVLLDYAQYMNNFSTGGCDKLVGMVFDKTVTTTFSLNPTITTTGNDLAITLHGTYAVELAGASSPFLFVSMPDLTLTITLADDMKLSDFPLWLAEQIVNNAASIVLQILNDPAKFTLFIATVGLVNAAPELLADLVCNGGSQGVEDAQVVQEAEQAAQEAEEAEQAAEEAEQAAEDAESFTEAMEAAEEAEQAAETAATAAETAAAAAASPGGGSAAAAAAAAAAASSAAAAAAAAAVLFSALNRDDQPSDPHQPTPPTLNVPTITSLAYQNNSIVVRWNNVIEAESYKIELLDSSNAVVASSTKSEGYTSASFGVSSLAAGTYHARVTAVASGYNSSVSNSSDNNISIEKLATVAALQFAYNSSSEKIDLSWPSVSGASSYQVQYFKNGSHMSGSDQTVSASPAHFDTSGLAGALESNAMSWQVVGTGDVIFTASGGLKVFTRQ